MLDIVAEVFTNELIKMKKGVTGAEIIIKADKLRTLNARFRNECNKELSLSAIKGTMHHILKTRTRSFPDESLGM